MAHGAANFLSTLLRAAIPLTRSTQRDHGGSEGREYLRWACIRDIVPNVARIATDLPRLPVVTGHCSGGLVIIKLDTGWPNVAVRMWVWLAEQGM